MVREPTRTALAAPVGTGAPVGEVVAGLLGLTTAVLVITTGPVGPAVVLTRVVVLQGTVVLS